MKLRDEGAGTRRLGRALLLALFLSASFALVVLAGASPAQAATSYRVCADVPWKKPTNSRQAAVLRKNERWSDGDQDDPSFSLDFPFDIRQLSGSISYDQGFLGGTWTLSNRSVHTIKKRCPLPGGKSRTLVLRLRGWAAKGAARSSANGLVITASPAPGRVQTVTLRGLGSRTGFSDRRVTLVPQSGEGCYVSHVPVVSRPTSRMEGYRNLQAPGISCREVRGFIDEYNDSTDLEGEFAGFDCSSGLIVYGGVLVTCEDAAGREMRFAYYYPTMYEDQAASEPDEATDPEEEADPDWETYSLAAGRPVARASARCGSVRIDSLFTARNLTASGMSCTTARREVRKGGVGAHGYQRYGGWKCRESSGLRYRCSKGGRSFRFRLVP